MIDPDKLKAFVTDSAERGCGVIHGGQADGYTCLDDLDSARAALKDGTQRPTGPKWGVEAGTRTRAFTKRKASGEGLCRGCRARAIIERNEYFVPGDQSWQS